MNLGKLRRWSHIDHALIGGVWLKWAPRQWAIDAALSKPTRGRCGGRPFVARHVGRLRFRADAEQRAPPVERVSVLAVAVGIAVVACAETLLVASRALLHRVVDQVAVGLAVIVCAAVQLVAAG